MAWPPADCSISRACDCLNVNPLLTNEGHRDPQLKGLNPSLTRRLRLSQGDDKLCQIQQFVVCANGLSSGSLTFVDTPLCLSLNMLYASEKLQFFIGTFYLNRAQLPGTAPLVRRRHIPKGHEIRQLTHVRRHPCSKNLPFIWRQAHQGLRGIRSYQSRRRMNVLPPPQRGVSFAYPPSIYRSRREATTAVTCRSSKTLHRGSKQRRTSVTRAIAF